MSPEDREKELERCRNLLKGAKNGRPKGCPDGYSHKNFLKLKATVDVENKLILAVMVKDNNMNETDDAHAIEALNTAVGIMRLPGDARNKLGAAKLVLEFTKAKPSSKSEVTINTAEDFLAQVLKREQEKDASK